MRQQAKNLLSTCSYLNLGSQVRVKKAIVLASRAHRGQKRFSGEPYIIHPLLTAQYLASLKLDSETIIAAVLHDLPEDTDFPLTQIKKEFGQTVAFLVDGVTKLGKVRLRKTWFGLGKVAKEELSVFERQTENLRKMILAMAKDIRVVLIKLADRRHNMKTLGFVPEEKQMRIAQETLEIYAPIASRLGMGALKGELEDLAFPFVYHDDWQALTRLVKSKYEERSVSAEKAKRQIAKLLVIKGMKPSISARAKHLYSLWRKLASPKYNSDIDQIYDLVAVRVVLESSEDCYKALGIIHNKWKPLPRRVKDYIAQPKANGYRSLHTTVFGPNGKIIEIQLRTPQMDEQAEFGIAAHWYRSQKKEGSDYQKDIAVKAPQKELAWVKNLAKTQRSLKNQQDFHEIIKLDIFSDRIFAYTPQGDVIDLPAGATAIDFAYAVHSEVGDKMMGAKYNGKMVPIGEKLENFDVVEILTAKNTRGPKPDWLNLSVSQGARYQIRRQLRRLEGITSIFNKIKKKRP